MSTPDLPVSGIRVLTNERYRAQPADPGFAAAAADAWDEITAWPDYAPTPLVRLDGLAARLGVAGIAYKDEGARFGLGSFKALGGAYAVLRVLQEAVAASGAPLPSSADLRGGRHRAIAEAVTVTTATDGNHGRSVAWGARMFGAKAVIFVPAACSAGRQSAIEALGARVVRIDGDYDAAVAACAEEASRQHWTMVADTTWRGNSRIPTLVTVGYSVMLREALDAFSAGAPPTHVFVQAGVGALAAAVCQTIVAFASPPSARVIVVEPEDAACLFESAKRGVASRAPGAVHSVMAGLDCGEASPLAWSVLQDGASAFVTIEDDAAGPAMRLLAEAPFGDPPIVAGESAVAGLIGLMAAVSDPQARAALDLTPASRVLLLGTEGATDPDLYRTMTGRPPGVKGMAVRTA